MLERLSALHGHPLLDTSGRRRAIDAAAAAAAAARAKDERASSSLAAVTLTLRHPHALLQISAFAATVEEAGARLSESVALTLPALNRFTGDAPKNLRATGPGIWQMAGDPSALPDAPSLRAALAGVATVVDLSHARVVLQISGAAAAKTIAKHCGLDLAAHMFPTGSATNTRFNHLGMTIARIDDRPTFELLVFRGYAQFVFEALAESAAEWNPELTLPQTIEVSSLA